MLFAALRVLVHGEPPAEPPTDSPQDWSRLDGAVRAVESADGKTSGTTYHNVAFLLADGATRVLYTTSADLGKRAVEARDDGPPMVAFYRPGRRRGAFEMMNLLTLEEQEAFEAGMDRAGGITPN